MQVTQQNKYKFITLLAFVFFIAIAVSLFSLLVRMARVSEVNIAIPFVLTVLLIVLAGTVLIMYLNTCNRNILLADENEKIKSHLEQLQLARKQEEKEEQEDQAVDGSKGLDINNYIHKIIPGKSKNNIALEKYCEMVLINLSKEFEIVQGLFFVRKNNSNSFIIKGLYAYYSEKKPDDFKLGEGLSGQVAKDQVILDVPDVPDDYLVVYSGLGKSLPKHLLIIPVTHNNKTIGIIELAAFKSFDNDAKEVLGKLSETLGEKIQEFIKPDKK